jgi:hypothetical protein
MEAAHFLGCFSFDEPEFILFPSAEERVLED